MTATLHGAKVGGRLVVVVEDSCDSFIRCRPTSLEDDGAIDITDLTAYFDSTETAPLHTFRFHRGPITCLHVPHMGVSESQTSGTEASAADDNKGRSVTAKHWLMSGGADGCVCLWDLEYGWCRASGGHYSSRA